jgi:RNA polymerase sigma-70 factor (ECF subfamily)
MTDADTETPTGEESPYPVLARDVLERLVERDPDALAALFDAYFDRIYGYVRRLVGSEHLAEDLTQDIFLHLYQALPKYDPERDLRPWIFTIATNKIRDFWRSRRHRDTRLERSLDAGEDGSIDVPDDVRPEQVLTRDEIESGIREAVEELPEGLRMTVVLRVYEGMSFEEIGSVLDRNEVAVRKRYSRAIDVLRRSIGRALSEEGR